VGFEGGAGDVLFYAEGVEATVGFESSGRWVGEVEGGGGGGHFGRGFVEVSRCGC